MTIPAYHQEVHEAAVAEAVDAGVPEDLIRRVDELDEETRMALFSVYCRACASADPGCFCWNDE